MKRLVLLCALATLGATWPAPTLAQASAQQAPEGSWTHAPTGIRVPEAFGTMARREITDIGGNALDTGIQFGSPSDPSFVTLYLYRSSVRAPSIWFESAQRALTANPRTGVAPDAPTHIEYVDADGSGAPEVGLFTVALTNEFSSTGLALTEVNGWLVKIRLTSRELDANGNRAALLAALAQLDLPTRGDQERPITRIAPCADALPTAAAQPVSVSTLEALLTAPAFPPRPPEGSAFCALDVEMPVLRVYRPLAGGEEYLLTLGDSGRAAHVRPVSSGEDDRYRVDVFDIGQTHIAGFFDDMPNSGQVIPLAVGALQGRSFGVVGAAPSESE